MENFVIDTVQVKYMEDLVKKLDVIDKYNLGYESIFKELGIDVEKERVKMMEEMTQINEVGFQ